MSVKVSLHSCDKIYLHDFNTFYTIELHCDGDEAVTVFCHDLKVKDQVETLLIQLNSLLCPAPPPPPKEDDPDALA